MNRTEAGVRLNTRQLTGLQELGIAPALLKPYAAPASAPQVSAVRASQGKTPSVSREPPSVVATQTGRATVKALLQDLQRGRAAPPQKTAQVSAPSKIEVRGLPVLQSAVLVAQPARVVRPHVVPGLDAQATWVVLCEANGTSMPQALVQGQATRLLDAMLAAVGLELTASLVSVPVNPPVAADGTAYLSTLQQALANWPPSGILVLGRVPAAALLGHAQDVKTLRAKVWPTKDATGRQIPVVVTYPPGWLLAHPEHKASAWHDLLLLAGTTAPT